MGALAAARSRKTEATPGQIREHRSLLHRILEEASERPLRRAMGDTPFGPEWTDLLLRAVEVSDFTVGPLFLGRARQCGDRTLFLLPPGRKEGRISWTQTRARILEIGRALLALRESGLASPTTPVALLGANSPEIALFDLACLVTGTRNVPVPANSPPSQAEFILRHAKSRVLFVGDDVAAGLAREAAAGGGLDRIYHLDDRWDGTERIAPFKDFLELGTAFDDDAVVSASHAIRSGDIATVMYTSGTTGDPKGVPFTHDEPGHEAVRPGRRLAGHRRRGRVPVLPAPLPHLRAVVGDAGRACSGARSTRSWTMSRWSRCCYSFQRVRPTTFISVPKKWIQVAESVGPLSAMIEDDRHAERDAEIAREARRAITGGTPETRAVRGRLSAAVGLLERFHSSRNRAALRASA